MQKQPSDKLTKLAKEYPNGWIYELLPEYEGKANVPWKELLAPGKLTPMGIFMEISFQSRNLIGCNHLYYYEKDRLRTDHFRMYSVMEYNDLDFLLNEWSKENKLFLDTMYQDTPVRSWMIVDKIGSEFQMWINIELDQIVIYAWDFKDRKWTGKVEKEELKNGLSKCLSEIEAWMGNNKPTRM